MINNIIHWTNKIKEAFKPQPTSTDAVTISQQAIKQYKKLCPVSSHKSKTDDVIKYKIGRALVLGQQYETSEWHTKTVLYYQLELHVKNNAVVNITKSSNKFYQVKESTKDAYDNMMKEV